MPPATQGILGTCLKNVGYWKNMIKMNMKHFVLITLMASVVAGYCPLEKIQNTGNCSYRIHCIGNIRGIRLPSQCMEASNDPVTVDLTLTDAIERFDGHIDQEFLASITTLRISGNWPRTELSLLKYTTRLEYLFLLGNHIESISGKPFYTLNSLDILDLSHNKLSQIDHLFRFELQTNKLRILYLSYNRIQNISSDAFAELTSLYELDLSYNFISNLTSEPFSNLTNLEVLRLNNNSIINLNGAVNNLHSLNHLYLKGNQIVNIDEKSLKIINHLETFDISSNHLEQINSELFSRHWTHFDNHAVCKIILSGNHITLIPNATDEAITKRFVRHVGSGRIITDIFTELDLSHNEISSIELRAFQSLIKLTSLNLSNNKLHDFAINADDVAYVKFLNLSGNYICHLYFESFSRMKDLQNLDLSHNQLDYIPDQTFYNNHNLRQVNITHNAIEKLDKLQINMFHQGGGILDLSNNGLSNLRIPHGKGLRLTVLLLKFNNISDPSLIDLWHQTDLKSLDLSHNNIRELQDNSLRLPVSLTYLDLGYNLIERIEPSTFLRIRHLKTLNLAHNRIKVIEYGTFRGLSSLLELDLSFNRIGMLDSKLMMDLKSLSILSLRFNGLSLINDEAWYGHKIDLKVYLDGNNFTCEWLAAALTNHNNGYTKMRPIVMMTTMSGHTLEGIPCTPEGSKIAHLRNQNSMVMVDERLLLTNQKILEAVKEQTFYLKKYIWRSIQEDAEKIKSFS